MSFKWKPEKLFSVGFTNTSTKFILFFCFLICNNLSVGNWSVRNNIEMKNYKRQKGFAENLWDIVNGS